MTALELDGTVDPAGEAAVRDLLEQAVIRGAVYRRTGESTNTMAAARVATRRSSDRRTTRTVTSPDGTPERASDSGVDDGLNPALEGPQLFLVDSQSAGRGRHGRPWISDAGTLTFTLVFDFGDVASEAAGAIPLAAGVGLAAAVEFLFAPLRVRLKWPNDVLVDGGKVAGILCESVHAAPGQVIVGIGVNVHSEPELGNDRSNRPRSLSHAVGRPVDRYAIFSNLVRSVIATVESLRTPRGSQDVVDEFRRRCHLTGRRVTATHRAARVAGMCRGIDSAGRLLVDTGDAVVPCLTGEASIVAGR